MNRCVGRAAHFTCRFHLPSCIGLTGTDYFALLGAAIRKYFETYSLGTTRERCVHIVTRLPGIPRRITEHVVEQCPATFPSTTITVQFISRLPARTPTTTVPPTTENLVCLGYSFKFTSAFLAFTLVRMILKSFFPVSLLKLCF